MPYRQNHKLAIGEGGNGRGFNMASETRIEVVESSCDIAYLKDQWVENRPVTFTKLGKPIVNYGLNNERTKYRYITRRQKKGTTNAT